MAAQKARTGNSDFRFRRARHNRPVGVAHNDVTDAHRGAAVFRALDLRSADRDVMIAAEILLNGGSKPGSRNIELNGSTRKPPPKRQETRSDQETNNANSDSRAPDPFLVTGQQCQQQPKAGNTLDIAGAGPLCRSQQNVPAAAGEQPTSIVEAPRAACLGWSCPLGRPLIRGDFRTTGRHRPR